MEINFLALLVAALSTLVVGFVWYNPKVFGNAWMRESGTTEEKMKGGNMALIFCLSVFYAFLIAFILQMLTIHQFGALGMVGGNPALAKPLTQNSWPITALRSEHSSMVHYMVL